MGSEEPILKVDNLNACLAVSDIKASAQWYAQTLGFELHQEMDFPELSASVAFLRAGGAELELVASAGFVAQRRPPPPVEHVATQGLTQLSFRVKGLGELAERVRSRGVSIVFGPVEAPALQLRAFFIRDNEGNLIEFIERYGSAEPNVNTEPSSR